MSEQLPDTDRVLAALHSTYKLDSLIDEHKEPARDAWTLLRDYKQVTEGLEKRLRAAEERAGRVTAAATSDMQQRDATVAALQSQIAELTQIADKVQPLYNRIQELERQLDIIAALPDVKKLMLLTAKRNAEQKAADAAREAEHLALLQGSS